MPKKDFTEIVCVLDRSGSMGSMGDEPINGFNQFLKEQKEVKGEANLTLVIFDNEYEVIHDGVNLKEVPELTSKVYYPRGMTALLDAVGKAVNTVEARLAKLEDEEKPEKIIVMVLTDGMENASQEFKKKAIKEKLEKLQKAEWEFIFMGSTLESFDDARDMGLQANSQLNYQATSGGLRTGYASMSSRMVKSRTGDK